MYCYIENDTIIRYNVPKPKAIGNTVIGSNATDDELRDFGYYPVVGTAPTYNTETQRLQGPAYQVDTSTRTVDKVYTVVDIPAEEFGATRMKACETALENLLDTTAQERTWKDCMSARAAAGYPSSFQPEGIAFVNWWPACWEMAHQILADVQAQTRPIPTLAEFLAEMPALVLP